MRLSLDRVHMQCFALLILLSAALAVPTPVKPGAAAFLCIVALAFIRRAVPGGALSLPFLYLALLTLFHLGLVVPVSLGAGPETIPRWLDSAELETALHLLCVATTVFAVAVLLRPNRTTTARRATVSPRRALFWGGLLVAISGACLLWTGVYQLGLLAGAYGDYWEQVATSDVRLFGFGMMLFPIGMLIAAYGASSRQYWPLAAVFAIVYGPLFVAGFRGHAIAHALAFLAMWRRTDPPVARRVAAYLGLALLVLVPAIRLARNLDRPLAEALLEAHPAEFFHEAGKSLWPLVATVELVESGEEPLWLGRSYLQAAARVLPNLSLGRAPNQDADDELSPSGWITRLADPWVFERGGGIGFSGVAEPYLNFWWPGVVVFFWLLGATLAVADRWISGGHLYGAVALALSGFVLLTVRNDAMGLVRAFLLSLCTVYVIHAVARTAARARRAAPTR